MAFKNCDAYTSDSKDKPVVECRLQSNVVLGQKVAIVPYDHPEGQFNGFQCLTSETTSVNNQGDKVSFETKQTIYKVV